jgi:hypothetical protein
MEAWPTAKIGEAIPDNVEFNLLVPAQETQVPF